MTTGVTTQIEGAATTTPLLETRALTKHFKVGGNLSRSVLHAVDEADLVIYPQEIVALVGESGSGKSTLARLLARVYRPTSGDILYQGRSLASMRTRRQSMAYRSDVPMVFQDPFSSLNPAFRVSHGIMRGLKLHRRELDRGQRRAEAQRVVEAVGLDTGRRDPRSVSDTSSAVGSGSESGSPRRSPTVPSSSSPTSRSPCWTCRSASGCST